jgi:hypothetical protein
MCKNRHTRLEQLVHHEGVLGAAGLDGEALRYYGRDEYAQLVGEAARLVSRAPGGDELEMRVSHPTVTVFLDRRGSSTVAVAVEAKHKVVKVLRRAMRRTWGPQRRSRRAR